jgi:hypothetical protein
MKSLSLTGISFVLLLPLMANAFESGSTGADGAFNPTASVQLTLPPSGIFNYTDITIPAGVTVTFAKNANNTPVILLATGDVTVDGVIDVNGSAQIAGAGGIGGPGGFDGGRGGLRAGTGFHMGGNGFGPGAGEGAPKGYTNAGAGGSFGSKGQDGSIANGQGEAGLIYGRANLRTLIGGSGGGGGGTKLAPSGGGGGGAILIAASGTITTNGLITARGGAGITYNGHLYGQSGSGSGGAIRLVATIIQGEGAINANINSGGINGGHGRIRLEAENLLRLANTSPGYSFATPQPLFFANFPTVKITTIAGNPVPSSPIGFRDVVLSGVTQNPVTIGFETNNIPPGTTIDLSASPERGTASTATSSAVTGSLTLGTASANIDLPSGNSVLFGQTTFTVTVASNTNATEYSKYAQNQKVEKLRFSVNTQGKSETTFITASGKEYTWPSNAVAIN